MATYHRRQQRDGDYIYTMPEDGARRHRRRRNAGELDNAHDYTAREEPAIEDLRRARASYYEKSPDERRREYYQPMAQEAESKPRKASSGSHRRHRSDGKEYRRRRRPEAVIREEEEVASEGGVYVFSKEIRESRRHQQAPIVEESNSAPTDRRHRTRPREESQGLAYGHARKSHRAGSVVSSARVRTRTSTKTDRERARNGGNVVQRRSTRATELPQAPDPPKDPRKSLHVSTGPVLRRSKTTTTRARSPPAPAPDPPDPTASQSTRPQTAHDRRKSSGLFGIFAPTPSKPPPPERKVQCLTCMDDVPVSKTAKLACMHRMCHPCLKRIFKMSVTDPQHMPPRCCTQDHIPLKHVERLLSDNFKVLWNKKFQEYTCANRIYCPTRGCGEWIKPSRIKLDPKTGKKFGQCKVCKVKVCTLCNGKWHGRKECSNDDDNEQFVTIAKEKGWQKCFNCSAMVELKEGCNHMTCRCNAEFCMVCAQVWKTCDCPWFNAPPEPAPFDRLNHMMVPEPVQPVQPVRGNFFPPPPPPPPGLFDRRAQERADEELARRLQRQADLNNDAEVQIYGYGDATGHHMNDDFRVRPHNPPPAPRPAPVAPAINNIFNFWENRGAQVRRRAVPPPQPRDAEASAMAGLTLDGTRVGAGRVGGWLQHVDEREGSGDLPSHVNGHEEPPRMGVPRDRNRIGMRYGGYM